ncbi:GNAT family N-acetyltransferase [Flavobacterium sp. WC2421]|jgi:uncharacterized protein|uniref:GNAT family N-acetyltransferase n=3 Tax=unclassified Flavobacterium TaxID=196869 RepID=A0AB39WGM4_9FLAO
MTQDIKLEVNDKKGFFYIENEGKLQAKMTFIFAGEHQIIIDHTEVNSNQNGKGFGKQMVESAVAYARERGIKILPLCPFAKNVFDKNTTLNDVL